MNRDRAAVSTKSNRARTALAGGTCGVLLLSACTNLSSESARPGGAPTATAAEQLLFDDFSYASRAEAERNGWILRSAAGWPGVPGAVWTDNVEVGVRDPDDPANRFMRMNASTDGTTTRQAQFCHQRKYFEGTYAARVRWSDAPVSGPDGDQVVETFYLIAPLKAPLDTDYSETDFEYLPNGGWGSKDLTLFATTWETFHPEPQWLQVNTSTNTQGSRAGWHVLTLQIANGQATYFIDDEKLATHGGPYYPEEKMSINFNLWFIRDQLVKSAQPRSYQQDVDWVLHQPGRVLTPAEVRQMVADQRRAGARFKDTVPANEPPLNSPCDF